MPLSLEREYDQQLSHTVWELERAVRRGNPSESLRRSLIEAHAQHLLHVEDIAEVPRNQRSILLLQPRPADSVLMLPGEGMGCDDLEPLAELLFKRGFTVLASSLSIRNLDKAGHSPAYWQTCLDETENRYDMLAHYTTKVAVLGVGMAGLFALQVAATRRVSEVLALFPTFGSEATWMQRLRMTLRRLVLRDNRPPQGWGYQRTLAAHAAREVLAKVSVPLFVLTEDRHDRSEAGRSAQVAQRLAPRPATTVRVLRPGEAPRVVDLPPAVVEEILGFLRRR